MAAFNAIDDRSDQPAPAKVPAFTAAKPGFAAKEEVHLALARRRVRAV
jgi:hypothetical protein